MDCPQTIHRLRQTRIDYDDGLRQTNSGRQHHEEGMHDNYVELLLFLTTFGVSTLLFLFQFDCAVVALFSPYSIVSMLYIFTAPLQGCSCFIVCFSNTLHIYSLLV